MKEKLFSTIPYLLLALFFTVILTVNSKTHVSEPVFSYKTTENIPEISAENNNIIPETNEKTTDKTVSENQNTQNSQIIEENTSEYPCFYTRNGTKYHLKDDCRYLKNSSKIIKTTIEFAKDLGLELCSGCQD